MPRRKAEKVRRHPGEGSIYQRQSDGLWVATLEVGYKTLLEESGRPVKDRKGNPKAVRDRKVVYGKTWEEARDKLRTAARTHEDGLPKAQERQTVAQFLEHWLEHSAKQRVRPRTLDSYRELAKLHVAPELGKKALVRLSPQDVQGMIAGWLALAGDRPGVHQLGRDPSGRDERYQALSGNREEGGHRPAAVP